MQAVATAELCKALEHALSQHFGVVRSIAKLERRPSPYRTSFALEELDLLLDDGTRLQLMFKDLGSQGLLAVARQAKPAFLYDPLREIETYRAILAPNRIGAATCYGAVIDPLLGRYWLFLEKVPGVELYQVGEFTTWQQVSRWLAVMHGRFAEDVKLLTGAAHLLIYDRDFYRLWVCRAQEFLRHGKALESRDVRRRFDRLTAGYDRVVERLVALPITFIHGEFYPSNVLIQETAAELRVCPVDWEMAAVGPGLIDLAALTAGRWTGEKRIALAMAYRAELVPNEGWPPAPEVFLAALDYCHLHLAVQWLGWASDWSPPPEHAQDWLFEALRLAEKLRL